MKKIIIVVLCSVSVAVSSLIGAVAKADIVQNANNIVFTTEGSVGTTTSYIWKNGSFWKNFTGISMNIPLATADFKFF